MSILDRFTRERHLTDDVLVEIWSAAAVGARVDAHSHLTACSTCRARYVALESWLAGIRIEAHTEADEAFPAERLAAQQAYIFRRLEALERPARIIAFPRASRPIIQTHRVAQRWVATAAAAGLVVGLAAGQILDLGRALRSDRGQGESFVADSRGSRAPAAPATTPVLIDEAFLYGDLDAPTHSVRNASLRVIDDFTPRARDFDR